MASHYFHENRVLEECLFRTNRLLKGVSKSRTALRAQVVTLRSQLSVEIQSRVFWETLAVDMAAMSPACADFVQSRMDEIARLTTHEILDEETEEE